MKKVIVVFLACLAVAGNAAHAHRPSSHWIVDLFDVVRTDSGIVVAGRGIIVHGGAAVYADLAADEIVIRIEGSGKHSDSVVVWGNLYVRKSLVIDGNPGEVSIFGNVVYGTEEPVVHPDIHFNGEVVEADRVVRERLGW